MRNTRSIGLRFTDKRTLGSFCESLTGHGIAFRLAGDRTIFMDEAMFRQLPRLLKEFSSLQASGVVQVYDATTTGKRRIPTREEAKEVLRRLAARRKAAR